MSQTRPGGVLRAIFNQPKLKTYSSPSAVCPFEKKFERTGQVNTEKGLSGTHGSPPLLVASTSVAFGPRISLLASGFEDAGHGNFHEIFRQVFTDNRIEKQGPAGGDRGV